MGKYCGICGTKLAENIKYCPKCGQLCVEEAKEVHSENYSKQMSTIEKWSVGLEDEKPGVILIISIITLLCIAFAAESSGLFDMIEDAVETGMPLRFKPLEYSWVLFLLQVVIRLIICPKVKLEKGFKARFMESSYRIKYRVFRFIIIILGIFTIWYETSFIYSNETRVVAELFGEWIVFIKLGELGNIILFNIILEIFMSLLLKTVRDNSREIPSKYGRYCMREKLTVTEEKVYGSTMSEKFELAIEDIKYVSIRYAQMEKWEVINPVTNNRCLVIIPKTGSEYIFHSFVNVTILRDAISKNMKQKNLFLQ